MQKNKNISILSHFLVWLAVFSVPYLLSYGQEQDINRIIAHFWIPAFFYVIIFYTNYFVLIDKLLFTKKTIFFIGVNILMIALFITLKEQIESNFFEEAFINEKTTNKPEGPPFKIFIYVQMILYMAPLLFSIVIKTSRRWAKAENERKEAVNFKLQSELQHLHYQLQPHFFFNSLNNIYAMVDISPDKAKTSIHSLSKLMRYMLYETNVDLIPLSKEIDFMKKYIDLMKLRISDKTTVAYQFPTEEIDVKIVPLLFISLIENAFKHGVSATKESCILIHLTCQENTIIFSVENEAFPKKTSDKSGSGIGLVNVEKRLHLLYPKKHKFTTSVKNNRFLVTLRIETD